jgi:alpha-ketoglutarate-dependent taurine dioxygenase
MLTLWDNYSVQHQAVFDYQGYRRYGERITVSSPATPKAYSAAS